MPLMVSSAAPLDVLGVSTDEGRWLLFLVVGRHGTGESSLSETVYFKVRFAEDINGGT